MRMMFSRYGVGIAMLAVSACFGGAYAVAGDGVPLTGSYSGNAWLEQNFTGAHCEGSGHFTQLGLVSMRCDAVFLDYAPNAACVGIGTGWGIPNVNRAVLVAANGDRLVLMLNDLACEISERTEFQATGEWYVDGSESTGRFAGATGTGRTAATVNFATGIFYCDLEGRISY